MQTKRQYWTHKGQQLYILFRAFFSIFHEQGDGYFFNNPLEICKKLSKILISKCDYAIAKSLQSLPKISKLKISRSIYFKFRKPQ